jgi:hypothetical protein
MEYRRDHHGRLTFLEHWGLILPGVLGLLGLGMINAFRRLDGALWLVLLTIAGVLLLSGAGLLLAAKLPVYRSRRYFTFGIQSIPAQRVAHYRWGRRLFLTGVALSFGLLLTRF